MAYIAMHLKIGPPIWASMNNSAISAMSSQSNCWIVIFRYILSSLWAESYWKIYNSLISAFSNSSSTSILSRDSWSLRSRIAIIAVSSIYSKKLSDRPIIDSSIFQFLFEVVSLPYSSWINSILMRLSRTLITWIGASFSVLLLWRSILEAISNAKAIITGSKLVFNYITGS